MTGSGQPADPDGRRYQPGGGLAVLAALVQAIGTAIAARGQPAQLDLLGYALLIVGGLALANRLRSPGASLLVVAAATVAYHLLDYPTGPTFVALVIAALVAIRKRSYNAVVLTVILTYVAWVVFTGPGLGRALVVAAWTVGLGALAAMAVHAARMAAKMAQEQDQARKERQRRQASEERLRIAQELHDVLGHHLSLINVRAGVGRHLMDRQPEQARAALDTIKEASAEALREVRSVLNALYPTGQAAPRAPTPRLERLEELTADAGLPVSTTISGEPVPLPAEIDRAAYRIVQEALTNVRRHAGVGATATILIEYREKALMVRVDDDGGAAGPVVTPVQEGNGVTGMRERATALGGSLTAEPLPEGGWRVRAVLPLPVSDQDGER